MRQIRITILSCFMMLVAVFWPFKVDASELELNINGEVYPSHGVELIAARTYVPLRLVSESLGHEVYWHQESRLVEITDKGRPAQGYAIPNKGRIQLLVQGHLLEENPSMGLPYIKNDRTMVPLRLIAENLGAEVGWDEKRRCVNIYQNQSSSQGQESLQTPVAHALPSYGQLESADSQPTQAIYGNQDVVYDASKLSIQGPAILPLEQVERYLSQQEEAAFKRALSEGKKFVPFPEDIGRLYYEVGAHYNIRGDLALAQAILETGYFQFGNEVLPIQNNYCGLGAIGRVTTEEDVSRQVFSKVDKHKAWLRVNSHGWWYDCPRSGVEAHIQHLYSYANTANLPQSTVLVDGRFNHGNRGKAICWSDLNGKWAVPGKGYGENIVNRYWNTMKDA